MLIASALMLIAGVVAVLVGSQLAWGQVSTDVGTVPLGFFLDLESIGAVIAVVGGALVRQDTGRSQGEVAR